MFSNFAIGLKSHYDTNNLFLKEDLPEFVRVDNSLLFFRKTSSNFCIFSFSDWTGSIDRATKLRGSSERYIAFNSHISRLSFSYENYEYMYYGH